jgi:hypothetical protein
MTDVLRFDEAAHRYTLGGRELPSVTTLIEAAGLVDLFGSAEDLAFWRDRGTAVHIGTELIDRDELDESTVADEVRPYLDAWRRFRRESGFTPEHIEMRLHHPVLRYAGTIDRIGTLRKHPALIDIKTGAQRRATGVQLAAYAELAAANGICDKRIRRYGCYLQPDGTYQLVPYTDTRDIIAFVSALQLWKWRQAA